MNLPTYPSASVKARNPALWGHQSPQERSEAHKWVKEPTSVSGIVLGRNKRIRQSSKVPNRWEQEWIDLVSLWANHIVMPHSMKLKLASGCWYEPDVMLWHTETKSLTAYEIKGFARDDAIVKLKVAARTYPWIEFWLVWRENGAWKYQRILA